MKRVAIYNIKGGVGKTSTAVNLAYLSAASGRRTLLWDLDPQAAATYILRVRAKVKGGGERVVDDRKPIDAAIKATDFPDFDLLPADFTYRHMDLLLDHTKRPTERLAQVLRPLRSDYDLVVLDCPPSVSLVSENILRAADLVLSPMIPATLSLRTFEQLHQLINDSSRPPTLTGFFSMVDRRKRLHRDMLEQLPQQRTDIATSSIPALSVIEQMATLREPVPHSAPRSAAAQAYRNLYDEVLSNVLPPPRNAG